MRQISVALLVAFAGTGWSAAQEPVSERTTVLVLVDASSSMNRRDSDDLSRAELARRAAATLFRDLDVDLEFVLFSDRARSIGPELGEFETKGAATALGDAMEKALEEHGDRPISAVVILSDFAGNAGTDPEEVAARLRRRTVPVFTLLPGVPRTQRDVAIVEVDGPEAVVAGDEVAFAVRVRSAGIERDSVSVGWWLYRRAKDERILPQTSEEIDRLLARAEKKGECSARTSGWETVRFQPTEEGDYLAIFKAVPEEGEEKTENNYGVHSLRVAADKTRILYVEGRPRYEYRFLKNSLLRDPKLLCHILLTSADPDFPQEFTAGASDPAFQEPLKGFPKSREDLFRYDVLILGDVDPLRLGGEEVGENIQAFVKESGGGLVLISGSDNPRLFLDKPALRALLPIEPDEAGMESSDKPFGYALTPEAKGKDERSPHPIILYRQFAGAPEKNVEHWEDRDERGNGQTGIRSLLRVKKLSPGATVLVQATRAGEEGAPLFAIQHYGQGRVFWSGTDETWLWRHLVGDYPWFYPFWQQVTSWARQGKLFGANRCRLDVDRRRYGLGEKVKVRVRVAGDSGPSLTVTVEPPEGKRQSLELRRDLLRDGRYEGEYLPQQAGTFLLWTGDDDTTRGEDRFSVDILSREDQESGLNEIGARRIADASYQIAKGRRQSFDVLHLPELRKELEHVAEARIVRRPAAPLEVVGFLEGKRSVARGEDVTVVVRAAAPAKPVLRFETEDGLKGEVPLTPRGTNRYVAVLRAVKSPLSFRVVSDPAQTEVHSVLVADPPVVDEIRIWYSYPKVYRLEDTPADRPLRTGAIEAPAGTIVRIRVCGKEPLKEAYAFLDRATHRLEVAGKEAEGSFELPAGAGEYRIRLVAESGLGNREPVRFSIRGIADQAPVVRFIDPDCEIEDVSEICRRPIVFEATDDFGPVEVALEWRLVGRSEWKRVATGRVRYELDLSSLDPRPRPGDRVEVRAVASDVGRRETSSTRALLVRSLAHVERNVVDGVESVDRALSDLARRQLKILDRARQERAGEDEEAKLRFRLLASDQEDVADRLDRARSDLEKAMNRGVFDGLFNRTAAERMVEAIREISGGSAREAAKHIGARNLAEALKPQEETSKGIDRCRELLLVWCDDRGVVRRVRVLEDLLGDVVKALGKEDDASARQGLTRMARGAASLDETIGRLIQHRTGDDARKLAAVRTEMAESRLGRRIAAAGESLEEGNRDAAWSQCEEITRVLESVMAACAGGREKK